MGQARSVRLAVSPGSSFDPPALRESASRDVVAKVYANGIPIGGMTYRLDPDKVRPDSQDPGACTASSCQDVECVPIARELLDCLKMPHGTIKSARVKHIGIDIELC